MKAGIKCGVFGCGRVGRALSVALRNSGLDLALLVDRNRRLLLTLQRLFPQARVTWEIRDWPKLDVLLLTVSDDAIASVAETLAQSDVDLEGTVVAHTNGALTAAELQPLKAKGAAIASMHPVQTLSGAKRDAATIRKSFFALEGEPGALPVLRGLIEKMGGRHFELQPEHKKGHHLACVLASNYVITLMKIASDLLKPAGIDRSEAKRILLPLMRNCIDNFEHQGLHLALTGPIARGDLQTVKNHLKLLSDDYPHLLRAYKALGLNTLELANELADASAAKLARIRDLLEKDA